MRALYSGGDGAWKNDLTNSLAMTAGKKLTYTPTVTGNRRQWTVMFNFRRTAFGVHQYILANETGGDPLTIGFDNNNKFRFYSGGGAAGGEYVSTRVFRDTEHLFGAVMYDSVARTVRVVINDQEIDDWITKVIPTANRQSAMNWTGARMAIGAYNNAAGSLEGPLSDFIILDGEVLTPAEVIAYRTQNVPFGNNVITTTKKFTTKCKAARFLGIALNVPTSGTKITNEGQLLTCTTATWVNIAHTDVLPTTGKYQVEFTQLGGTGERFLAGTGLATEDTFTGNSQNVQGNYTGMQLRGDSACKYYSNSDNGTSVTPASWGGSAFLINDVATLYLDMDARKMYFKLNGVEPDGMSVAISTGGADINSADIRMYFDLNNQDSGMEVNFGQTDYAYPVTGYGPLQEPAKSDLKRCKLLPTEGVPGVLTERGLHNNATTTAHVCAYSNFVMKGKMYFEAVLESTAASNSVGVAPLASARGYSTNNQIVALADSVGLYQQSSNLLTFTGGVNQGTFVAGTGSSILMFAGDFDAGTFWQGADGVWDYGDPSTGTGGHALSGSYYVAIVSSYSTGVGLNFGDSDFSYTPPTGFVGPASLDFETLRPAASTGLTQAAATQVIDGLVASHAAASFYGHYSDYLMKEGVYYAEMTMTDTVQIMLGVFGPKARAYGQNVQGASDWYGIYDGIASHYLVYTGGGSAVQSSDAALIDQPNGTVMGMLLDIPRSKLFYRTPAGWYGDPVAGTGGIDLEANQVWAFAGILYSSSCTWNFGATAFAYTDQGVYYQELNAQTALQQEFEYGPNGTQMLFEDSSKLGASTAGNLLPWTLTGITSSDQLDDTPGDPWAVLSALDKGPGVVISNGGLHATLTTDDRVRSTQAFKAADSFAMKAIAGASTRCQLGVVNEKYKVNSSSGADSTAEGTHYHGNGQVYVDGALQVTLATYTTNDVIEICMSEGFVWFVKNGTPIQGDHIAKTNGFATSSNGGQLFFSMETSSGAAGAIWDVDFGQRGYVPPAGFKVLRSSNKATPKYHGRDTFDITSRTTSNASSTSNTLIKPGFSWHKLLTGASAYKMFDQLRSPELGDHELACDRSNAEGDGGQSCAIVYSEDGIEYDISIGTSDEPSALGTYIDYMWKLSDTVTNTDGSISCQIAAAPEGHITLIRHSGNSVMDTTIGHGMLTAPEAMISKAITRGSNWPVYFETMGPLVYKQLDQSAAPLSAITDNIWNSIAPTDSVINLGNSFMINTTGNDYIHYCFRSVPGVCAVVPYTGDGLADGPFINLDFLPRWVYITSESSSAAVIVDLFRDPINDGSNEYLLPYDTAAEGTTTYFDFTSKGIKIRSTSGTVNTAGRKYHMIVMADVAGGGDLPAVLAA